MKRRPTGQVYVIEYRTNQRRGKWRTWIGACLHLVRDGLEGLNEPSSGCCGVGRVFFAGVPSGRCIRERVCCAALPLLTTFGRTLFRGSEITFALCNIPPSRTACSVGPPRLTSRPPEGGCYAARIHVWVRFLLPRTNLAMNANHRSQESA